MAFVGALLMIPLPRLLTSVVIEPVFNVGLSLNRAVAGNDEFAKCVVATAIADPTVEPATIRLKAYGTQALYLQALPLHDSQRTVAVTDSYTLFELCVKPTYDFYQELLSHGPEVEVTAPAAVRREMGRLVAETARRYRIADGENP